MKELKSTGEIKIDFTFCLLVSPIDLSLCVCVCVCVCERVSCTRRGAMVVELIIVTTFAFDSSTYQEESLARLVSQGSVALALSISISIDITVYVTEYASSFTYMYAIRRRHTNIMATLSLDCTPYVIIICAFLCNAEQIMREALRN